MPRVACANLASTERDEALILGSATLGTLLAKKSALMQAKGGIMSTWSTPYFTKLLTRIEVPAGQLDKLGTHRGEIQSRLGKVFDLSSLKGIGSHSRHCAIKDHSDLDLMAVISKSDVERSNGWVSSKTILDKIRTELGDRFWQTATGRDGQAVVVNFGSGSLPVDVVPAVFSGWNSQPSRPLYCIPDGNGGWMLTSPEAHNAYISDADARSGGKLKSIARLIKYWRVCRQPPIPLSGFHAELVLASENVCGVGKSYAECLRDFFAALSSRAGRSLQDPLGISGLIPCATTYAQQDSVAKAASYALDHADRALRAEWTGDYDEAYRQWDLVFNRQLPASP